MDRIQKSHIKVKDERKVGDYLKEFLMAKRHITNIYGKYLPNNDKSEFQAENNSLSISLRPKRSYKKKFATNLNEHNNNLDDNFYSMQQNKSKSLKRLSRFMYGQAMNNVMCKQSSFYWSPTRSRHILDVYEGQRNDNENEIIKKTNNLKYKLKNYIENKVKSGFINKNVRLQFVKELTPKKKRLVTSKDDISIESANYKYKIDAMKPSKIFIKFKPIKIC